MRASKPSKSSFSIHWDRKKEELCIRFTGKFAIWASAAVGGTGTAIAFLHHFM